ncbi:unnamed protein product [Trifolium pratense]|uniref:Uncharacterized protein n=1 Tax=Trifolium pratense TaxID=57577 RepID=A0ACB0KW79_TRIPR|nr:unnamed protein product [Trifolium pratense]
MCMSIPHQPPQPRIRAQPREPKTVEKREALKFLTQIAMANFFHLVVFGSIDSFLNLLVHCFYIQFMVFGLLGYSSLLFKTKFQIFVFMALYAGASLIIMFKFSTDYSFVVALFAWLLAIIIVLFPKSIPNMMIKFRNFFTKRPCVAGMLLVAVLATFIGIFMLKALE